MVTNMKKNKIVTFIFVLSPIFSMYNIGVATSISILDYLLLFLLLNNYKDIIKQFKNKNINLKIVYFMLYIILQLVVILIIDNTQGQMTNIILRTLRYLFYLFSILTVGYLYFDYNYAVKILRFLTLFSMIYFFLQLIILRTQGYYIKGYISFIPVTRQELVIFSENAWNGPDVRVRSIYGEISQYAIVASIYLFTTLGDKNEKKIISIVEKLLLILSLVLTVSNVAYAMLFLFILSHSIVFIKNNITKINFRYLLFAVIVAIFSIYIFSHTSIYLKLLKRFEYSFGGRFNGYLDYLEKLKVMNISNFIFGHGANSTNLNYWYPSLLKIQYYFGFIGSILMLVILFNNFYNSLNRKFLIICIFVMSIATEILIGNLLVFILPFLLKYPVNYNKMEV